MNSKSPNSWDFADFASQTGFDSGTLALLVVKIKDPSFHNWQGVSIAVRENGISDFPLCNKSFDLSYAGHDL
jgi:Ni,Fe-hydrogenase III large subunit